MSDKSIFDAIQARDLGAVSAMIHRDPWTNALNEFESGTGPISQAESDLRARLGLESRDRQERAGANTWQDRDADEYGVNRTGPID